jgi:hypothetical protein
VLASGCVGGPLRRGLEEGLGGVSGDESVVRLCVFVGLDTLDFGVVAVDTLRFLLGAMVAGWYGRRGGSEEG